MRTLAGWINFESDREFALRESLSLFRTNDARAGFFLSVEAEEVISTQDWRSQQILGSQLQATVYLLQSVEPLQVQIDALKTANYFLPLEFKITR